MIGRMGSVVSVHPLLARWARALSARAHAAWHTLELGAQILALTLSPATFFHTATRRAALLALVRGAGPLLPWFTVLSSLVSLVVIRIVVATATSYGLSQYALEVLVRTLVLELIPLFAALFVALRLALPQAQRVGQRLSALQARGGPLPSRPRLAHALFAPALAAQFAVVLLAALSGVVALLMTYLTVYGFSPWGWPAYTHAVGAVFSPGTGLIFALKTIGFALAVAVVPLAAVAQPDADGRLGPRGDLGAFARLFSVLLAVEIASLLGNYA